MPWSDKTVSEAIAEAKLKNAIFVVYIQDGTKPSNLHDIVVSPEVTNLLDSDNFLGIRVDRESQSYSDFAQIYQLVPVPSLFFIGQNGWPLEIISSELTQSSVIHRIKKLIPDSDQMDFPSEHSMSPMNTSDVSSDSLMDCSTGFELTAAEADPSDAVHMQASSSESADPLLNEMTSCGSNVLLNISAPASNANKLDVKADAESSKKDVPNVTKDQDIDTSQIQTNVLDKERNQGKKTQNEGLSAKGLNPESSKSESDLQPKENRSIPAAGPSQKSVRFHPYSVPNLENQPKSTTSLQNTQRNQGILSNISGWMNNVVYGGRSATLRAAEGMTGSRNEASCSTHACGDQGNLDSGERWPVQTHIQFRLPDGTTHSKVFTSITTMAEVRDYVMRNISLPFGDFCLSTSYPRLEFSDEHNDVTLGALGLAPRSVILIIPGSGVSLPSRLPAAFGALWALILWPFTTMYSLFSDINVWLFGAAHPAVNDTNTTPSQPRVDQPSSSIVSPQSSSRNLPGGRRRLAGRSTVRRDGNVHRLSNRLDDSEEDDNNTWNGNSTQQM